MDELYVRVTDGGEICVPTSSVTTYVLLEQEDWFENEIAFVRRLLRPGMRVVDIGANYGTYTLAMARAVGPAGKVYAYEPASATARYLHKTIARNRLTNVEMAQAAISDRIGRGHLRIAEHVEMNRLEADGNGEEVPLTTIDAECNSGSWGAIDFIKIDAEGGELRILRGGEVFFSAQSPLAMFERKSPDGENEDVQSAFRVRGYGLFKLIGPDLYLVPVDERAGFDDFDLNLFACKPERAEKLVGAGVLTRTCAATGDVHPGCGIDFWHRQQFASAFKVGASRLDPNYERALDAYATWRNLDVPLAERSGALVASAHILKAMAPNTDNVARMSTCARVAHEAGLRSLGAEYLSRMLNFMMRERPGLHEPFWPAAARYDSISPGSDPQVWFLAATLEAYEERRAFSSCFAPPGTLAALDWLSSTPYASPAMERRRQLMAIRAGRQRHRQSAPLLVTASAGHLNPQLWGGRSG
jgi:FkbM family methyltransferase